MFTLLVKLNSNLSKADQTKDSNANIESGVSYPGGASYDGIFVSDRIM